MKNELMKIRAKIAERTPITVAEFEQWRTSRYPTGKYKYIVLTVDGRLVPVEHKRMFLYKQELQDATGINVAEAMRIRRAGFGYNTKELA